ncbi:hypothetical protein MUK42_15403 [Musa troglodytarum]|uniref:Uncharacterized protein n=1 Tax=Musa troglodytarum TaxID=320322 RepID=A0A9E7KZC8_9LILI|nr:hypothetical protein MUK42_15403 [Musa troglodytarum]
MEYISRDNLYAHSGKGTKVNIGPRADESEMQWSKLDQVEDDATSDGFGWIRVTDRRKTHVLRQEHSSRFCTPAVTHVEEETGWRYVSCLQPFLEWMGTG